MPFYAVTITYGDKAARNKARPDHRAYLERQLERGTLVNSGPFVDDSGALLIYEADSADALEAILNEDPYWKSGCLATVVIKEWTLLYSRT